MTRPISLSHRLEYAGLRTAVAALSALRWRRASSLGGALGRLGYTPFGVRRRVVERQIAAAFPEWDPEHVARVARGAYDHLGRLAVETALMPSLGQSGVRELVSHTTGWELMQQADAENQQQPGVALKRLRMIDPKLGQGGEENQRRDPDLLQRLRQGIRIDQPRKPKQENPADDDLPDSPVFQGFKQLAFGASPALFRRSEAFLDETLALKETEHRQGESHAGAAKINV